MSRYFSTLNGPAYVQADQLYERKAVTDQWNKLTMVAKKQWKWKNLATSTKTEDRFILSQKRLIQVYGPPGTGKTSATFGWLNQLCSSLRTQALWINCQGEGPHACWLVDGTTQGARGPVVSQNAIPSCAEDTLGYCAVVFDGVRQEMVSESNVADLMFNIARTGVFVVVVSSEGVRLPAGQSNDVAKLRHFVPSWTRDEHVAACGNDNFWRITQQYFEGATDRDDANQRARLLDAKFEVAGHSARFMFHLSPYQAKSELQVAASAVTAKTLEEAIGQTASSGAVNTVVARFEQNKNGTTPVEEATFPIADDLDAAGTNPSDFFPTSEESELAVSQARIVSLFATQEVIKNLPTDVRRLRSLADKLSNRAILGYAFELQLQSSLRGANTTGSLSLTDEDGNAEELPVSRYAIWSANEVEDKLGGEIEDNTWIFVGGRQGLHDAIHVVSSTHIRFVQATVGKGHSFKLSILATMIQNLFLKNKWRWTHVDFVMLRPSNERDRPFNIKSPDGALQKEMLRFDGEPWATNKDWINNARERFLDWEE